MRVKKFHVKSIFSLFLIFTLLFTAVPQIAFGQAYNSKKDYTELDLRFWEDEKPDIGFYINSAAKYTLETVPSASFGSEWNVMNLLRGLYTRADYINYIPENYFENYINSVEKTVQAKEGKMDRSRLTEWSRPILSLTALGYDVTNIAGYNFIEAHSVSPTNALRYDSENGEIKYTQGINAATWALIAINSGEYELPDDNGDPSVNTEGKMLDFIINAEITQDDGTVGGWALFGNRPDTDIGGMVLQALAPYYVNKEKYEQSGAKTSFGEFARAVERGVYTLSKLQLENGGYSAMGFPGATANSQSIVQVLVALTALGIDPLAENIELKHISKNVNFITDGATVDGVETNNMIDALLTFWANGSGSAPEIGGFKNVLDYGVNGMATEQSLYGLIAYDRFLKGENSLYDMTDMMNGEYKQLLNPPKYNIDFLTNDGIVETLNESAYAVINIPEAPKSEGKEFIGWNSKEDGSGTDYKPGERLVIPEHDIALYAQYEYEEFNIHYELNGGTFTGSKLPKTYTVNDEVTLPSAEEIALANYEFKGWFDNEQFKGEPITKISKGSLGDKTFYAKWGASTNVDDVLVNEVVDLINGLPSEEELSLSHKHDIELSRLAFNRLPNELKSLVHNSSKLTNLEKALENLQERINKEKANKVEELINSLPSEDELIIDNTASIATFSNTNTETESNHKALLDAARKEFYRLTAAQQDLVSREVQSKLFGLEKEMFKQLGINEDEAAANIIDYRIAGLPEVNDITLDDEESVNRVLESYNALSEDARKLVEYSDKLENINKKINTLKSEEEEEIQTAKKVDEIIKNLPNKQDLTLQHMDAVLDARKAYEGLNEKQKFLVTNIRQLLLAEETIEQLEEAEEINKEKAKEIDTIIASLPPVESITLEQKTEVVQAREAYESLTNDQKRYVTNIDKLQLLEAKLEELEKEEEQNENTNENEGNAGQNNGSNTGNNNNQGQNSGGKGSLGKNDENGGTNKTSKGNKNIQDDRNENLIQETKQDKTKKTLPNTATTIYNILLIGLALLFAGFITYYLNRRVV